jgi:predicted flap endonuclease-1-like 5' DNA nuclease
MLFYTLSTWALWLVGAALIGAVVGWLLRGLRARSADQTDSLTQEIQRLRSNVSELQGVTVERDRLSAELEQARSVVPDAGIIAALNATRTERDELAIKLTQQSGWVGELRVRLWNAEARARDLQAVVDANAAYGAPPRPDLIEGSKFLGVPVENNDFTLLEGVGPRIAQLLHERGLTTWWALANADVELLRSVLAEAGPKFQIHDPRAWPQQARLLANGQWEKFATLAAALRHGHPSQ